jgi:hydroxymethylpyrimidine pyrophosphatase-like HAD family hydrolase
MADKKLLIAFDVDGTLIDDNDQPREGVINTLELLYFYSGADIIVWSGGGADYAEMWGNRINLPHGIKYMAKTNLIRPDIAFDDVPEFDMADKVIIIKD